MLISGVYLYLVRYRFQIIKTNKFGQNNLSMMLLSAPSDGTDMQITANLTGAVPTSERDNIVSHIILDARGEIAYSYGDIELSTMFSRTLAKLGIIESITDGSTQDTFVNDLEKITVCRYRENYTFIRRVVGLDYTTGNKKVSLATYLRKSNIRDLETLKSIYDLSWILNADNSFKRPYHCITTTEELDNLLIELKQQDIVSFDLETNGLDIYYQGGANKDKNYINGIGLCWKENEAYYIPLESDVFDVLDKDEVCHKVLSILTTKKLIGANLKFDMRVCYHLGYCLSCYFDVIQAEFSINPGFDGEHRSIGLKSLTRKYLNEETLELDEVLGGSVDGNMIKMLDKDVITIYGCSDVDYALKIYNIQKNEVKFMQTLFNNDMKMMQLIAVSDYYGNYLDLNLLEILHKVNKDDFKRVELTAQEYIFYHAKIQSAKKLLRKNYNVINPDPELIKGVLEADEVIDLAKSMCYNSKGQFLNFRSGIDLTTIFVDILDYPVITTESGNYSFDSDYLNRLEALISDKEEIFLKEDLISSITKYNFNWVKQKDTVLLSKESLSHAKYPFVKILLAYRQLDKRETAFFSKLEGENFNGWYNSTNNMIKAKTGRITNPVQTLQGYMKKVIQPYDGRYMIIFDLAQVEFRVMIGLASHYWSQLIDSLDGTPLANIYKRKDISYLIDKLNIPWADYHREGGSLLTGSTPSKMTKEERSEVKGPHFAAAYGGTGATIAKPALKHVFNEDERKKIIAEKEQILDVWKNKMFALYNFLEYTRDKALEPVLNKKDLPLGYRDLEIPLGVVKNALGRRRFFKLDYENVTRNYVLKKYKNLNNEQINTLVQQNLPYIRSIRQATIRREVGNFPIQSFARDLFVLICLNLFKELKSRGLTYQGAGKDEVVISTLVHDEAHLQIQNNHHPFEFYEIIYDKCMIQLKGFPRFYCGISVVSNWAEGKEDKYEAPIEFVEYIVKDFKKNKEKYYAEDWQADPKQYVFNKIKEWFHNYVDNHIKMFTKNNVFSLTQFRDKNENYFLNTNTKWYTDKFTNKENDITEQELIILSHNQNPDLIVDTGERCIKMSDYKFDYIKKPEVKPDSKDFDLTDIFMDLDLDEDYTINDNDEREEDAVNCYWLYNDNERVFNDAVKEAGLKGIINDNDTSIKPATPRDKCVVLMDDAIIIDLTLSKEDYVRSAVKYLNKFKTTSINGLSLYWRDRTGLTKSKIKISEAIDIVLLKNLIVPDDEMVS